MSRGESDRAGGFADARRGKIKVMSEMEDNLPMPPATFEFLVLSIRTQAEIHLGLLRLGGEEEKAEPNLPLARHSIDLLAMLQEKSHGNLTVEEERLLSNSLTELRFRYIQASEAKPAQS
jgi:hypothetical protein